MRPTTSKAIAVALVLGSLGAPVFVSLTADSGPFGGSEPPASCGVNMSCVSEEFTATTSSGTAFECSSQLGSCVDLGPGNCDMVGTDGSGFIQFGDGCSPVVDIGDTTRIQPGQAIFTNGGLFLDGTTYIQNQSSTVKVNDADGFVINSTSAITGMLVVAVTIDIPTIVGDCDLVTATVAGVEANDFVSVTANFDMTVEVQVSNARVTNAGTDEVTFMACDPAAGGADPASGSYLFWVVRKA